MAKSTPTKMPLLEKRAAKTSADLRLFYKMGVEANKAAAIPGKYGKKVNDDIAEKYVRSDSSVAQARIFADLVKETKLEQICQLRNSKGAAFGLGLATILTSLKKPKDRVRVLGLWQKKSLSASDMRAVIKAKFGKSVRAGRKSKQPNSAAEAINELHDRCSNLVKWHKQLADKDVGEMTLQDLPPAVRNQLKATMLEIKKLHDVVVRAILKLKKKMKKD